MLIISITLSIILIVLIGALIFKADFRKDVLNSGENSFSFKDIKFQGALFWVVYALTAVATVYLAVNSKNQTGEPVLQSKNPEAWIALGTESVAPIQLEYGYDTILRLHDDSQREINLNLSIDSLGTVCGTKSGFRLGQVKLDNLPNLKIPSTKRINQIIELYYALDIEQKSSELQSSSLYDVGAYENLPFQLQINIKGDGLVQATLHEKGSKQQKGVLSLVEKRFQKFSFANRQFIFRTRSRDIWLNEGVENEHINIQIFEIG